MGYAGGMKSKLITRAELFALVGVTGQKNSKVWEQWGMPVVKRKMPGGGRPVHLYDREAALRWLAGHASFNISRRARKALQELESEPPEEVEDCPAKRGAEKPPAVPCWNMEPGTAGAFARLKEAELAFSSMLQAALARGDVSRAATCAGQVVALADGLAKLEAHLQGRADNAGAVEVAAALSLPAGCTGEAV